MNKDMENTFNQMAEFGGSPERLGRNNTPFINAPIVPKNTRPSAPVEGLETVAYQYQIPRNGHWDNLPSDWTADECKAYDKKETRELVTRSQAEAIIAAKDAEIERWHKKAMDAGVIVHSDGTTSHPMRKERDDLEVDNVALTAKLEIANTLVTCCCGNPVDIHGIGDGHSPVDQYHYAMMQLEEQNAALTARVKEWREESERKSEDWFDFCKAIGIEIDTHEAVADAINTARSNDGNEFKALETKLAATKKALERADEALQLGATEPGHTYVKIALGEVQS